MRRTILIAAVLCCFVVSKAAAGFYDGNELLEQCEKKKAFCPGYISAVHDTISLTFLTAGSVYADKVCVLRNVQLGQLIDVVILYLKSKPEKRNLEASFLVFDALREKFPCN